MSKTEADRFQKDIRRGLQATADQRFRERLAEIDAELRTQRAECSQELTQIIERLDAAVDAERIAVAIARSDKARAEEARRAAQHRLHVATDTKRAKSAQKSRSCKVEGEAIAERRQAVKEHRSELRRIDALTRKRKKPLATKRERRSEERDQVESNIAPELVPLWREVARTFHVPKRAEGRVSLTEAFEAWAAENPDAVIAAQEREVERELAAREEQERRERRKRGRGRGRRADLSDVPF